MSSEQSIPDIVIRELEYRRKKQWDIFSWCSTLLVAIIGGIIALRMGTFAKQPMTYPLKWVIASAVIVLAAEAILWITHNHTREQVAQTHLDEKTREWLKYDSSWSLTALTYSSRVVIVLLAIAALVAIAVPI